jgi:hypothetical protein
MKAFSKSLKSKEGLQPKDLREVDRLLRNQIAIPDEASLTQFLATLPAHLASYKEKIDVYLRHRDIIPYCNMSEIQALHLYTTIRTDLTPKGIKDLDEFFNPCEDNVYRPDKLIKHLVNVTGKHPGEASYTLICLSLIGYIGENSDMEGDLVETKSTREREEEESVRIHMSEYELVESELVESGLAESELTKPEVIIEPLTVQ